MRERADHTDDTLVLDGPPLVLRLRELISEDGALDLPEAIAPRLAYEDRHTVLVGRAKQGKSTLACAVTAAVSSGSPFLGELPDQQRVLYVSVDEHPNDTGRRLHHFGANSDTVHVCRGFTDPENPVGELKRLLQKVQPGLVVIDTLEAFQVGAGTSTDSNDDMARIVGGISRVAHDQGVAILTLHHGRKSDGEFRGASAIKAHAYLMLTMRGAAGRKRTLVADGRGPDDEFSVRLLGNPHEAPDGNTPRYVLEGEETPIEIRTHRYIVNNPGCSTTELRRGVEGKGQTIDDAATSLEDDGKIVIDRSGNANKHSPASTSQPVSQSQSDGGTRKPLDTVRDTVKDTASVFDKKPGGHATDTARTRSSDTADDPERVSCESPPIGDSQGHAGSAGGGESAENGYRIPEWVPGPEEEPAAKKVPF